MNNLRIEDIPWSLMAETKLLQAANGDIEEIKADVMTGKSQLWVVLKRLTPTKDDEIIYSERGYVVTRVEIRDNSTTLVIIAGVGKDSGALKYFVDIADENGWNMRIHSNRPGMGRYLDKYGFSYRESIYQR